MPATPSDVATPVGWLASLCRHHSDELGLATDGRWWAPRGGLITTTLLGSCRRSPPRWQM